MLQSFSLQKAAQPHSQHTSYEEGKSSPPGRQELLYELHSFLTFCRAWERFQRLVRPFPDISDKVIKEAMALRYITTPKITHNIRMYNIFPTSRDNGYFFIRNRT